MGKIFSRNHAALICCLISILFVLADTRNTDAVLQEDELFVKAYDHYLSYRPEKAIELFDIFLQEYPDSSSRDAALFWKARSLVQINKKDEAVDVFKRIIDKYPSSHFRGFAESEIDNIKRAARAETDTRTESDSKKAAIAPVSSPDNEIDHQTEVHEYQKKLKIFEEAVLRSDKDKKFCLETLEEQKRKNEDLFQKTKDLSALVSENDKEKKEFESEVSLKLQLSQESISKTVEANNICLEALEREKQKNEDLSQSTNKLSGAISENQELKKELKLKEEQMQIKDQKHKEDLKLIEDCRIFEADLKDCDTKMKAFYDEKRKNEEKLAEVFDAKNDLIEKLKSSEKIEKELKETILRLENEGKPQEDKAYIEENTNRERAGLANTVKDLKKEISVLSERLKQLDIPLLKIDDKKYTAVQIIDEYLTASNVENKLRQKTIPWKKGNPYEDFMMEQLLLKKAHELKIKEDPALHNRLIEQYHFNEKEKAYLTRFLTIDKLIANISGNINIPEQDIKKYYEKNKNEFLLSKGKRIIYVLSVDYSDDNEIERNLLTIDIQNKAATENSLENIQRKQPDVISLKQYDFSMMPDWVREESEKLKEGEISNIISKDSKYIIIQWVRSKPVYEKYEDVRYLIRANLLAKSRADDQRLNEWLKEIRNSVEKNISPSKRDIAQKADEKTVKTQNKSVVLKKKISRAKKTTLRKRP